MCIRDSLNVWEFFFGRRPKKNPKKRCRYTSLRSDYLLVGFKDQFLGPLGEIARRHVVDQVEREGGTEARRAGHPCPAAGRGRTDVRDVYKRQDRSLPGIA